MMGPGQVAQVVRAVDMPRFWVQSLGPGTYKNESINA